MINSRCRLHTRDGFTVVSVAGVPIFYFSVDDEGGCAYAQVLLVGQGWADQNDVARAFKRDPRTVRRHQRRFEKGGLGALGRATGYPKGRGRVGRSLEDEVLRLKTEGRTAAWIAGTVGVKASTIGVILKRRGWKAPTAVQQALAEPGPPESTTTTTVVEGEQAEAEEIPQASEGPIGITLDEDPTDRKMDRLLAYKGMIADATPLFGDADGVPGVGALLAVPVLVNSGVLPIARKVYGSLGPAFYGLRTTIVTLLLMALLRVKRAESLKERSPGALGRLLGLDRAPEMKTLRRKLTALAAQGRAEEFGRALASERVKNREEMVGLLYVDGHVRAYHGKRDVPKTHVGRLKRILPGTTDYWIHDSAAEPLLLVTAEANAGLVKMLPDLVKEARTVVGDRELTMVFDRGGFSPKLFKELIGAEKKVHVMTYRKGRWRNLPVRRFERYEGEVDGRRVKYNLADGDVVLSGGLRLRQVTRRTEDGHQTPILTSRRDLSALEVAARMFGRWRQENFFKYLREEYALDGLVDYDVAPADPERDIPNPVLKPIEETLSKARKGLEDLQAEYGRAAQGNQESLRPSMRGFKIANGALGKQIKDAQELVAKLQAKRAKIPKRVPVGKTTDDVIELAPERKHLTSVVKMVAYQAETDLLHRVQRLYRRSDDEGRTLLQTVFNNSGDLRVSGDSLQVNYAPLSSPHRTAVLDELCAEMTALQAHYPGTHLRLTFSVNTTA